MDKTTQLFIRACTSDDIITRINKVYKRFYGDYGSLENKRAIASIMLSIVDKHTPMTLTEYHRRIGDYDMYNSMTLEEDTLGKLDLIICICRDKIAHTKTEDLIKQGVTLPLRWRNK